MRRTLTLTLLALSLLALSVGPALAAPQSPGGSPHVVGTPSVSGIGTDEVTITGKIAGLGSGWSGATATGDVLLEFNITCVSPGGNEAPGQQGGTTTAPGAGTVTGPDSPGQYTFTLTSSVTGSPKQLGCPNNRWTAIAEITSAELQSLTLRQGNQTVNVRL